jgi:hypothetical protein
VCRIGGWGLPWIERWARMQSDPCDVREGKRITTRALLRILRHVLQRAIPHTPASQFPCSRSRVGRLAHVSGRYSATHSKTGHRNSRRRTCYLGFENFYTSRAASHKVRFLHLHGCDVFPWSRYADPRRSFESGGERARPLGHEFFVSKRWKI